MSRFSLDQIAVFAEVIACGSFSAAADRLDVSQPAVSLQVRQLERRLSVRLIERVGRRATPTPAGAELLVHARRIGEAVSAAEDALAPFVSGAVGRVRIGAGDTACIYFLPAVLRELRRRFPTLDLTVKTGNTSDMLRQIEENSLDLGVVTLPAPGRMFDVTPLFEDEFLAVFSPDAKDVPRTVTPAALARLPVVLYEPGAQTRRIVDDWFAAAEQAVKPIMELGSVEAIKELVGAGLGCGVIPGLAVQRARGLVVKPLAPRLARTLGLVMRRDKPLHRGLRETIAALRKHAAGRKGRK